MKSESGERLQKPWTERVMSIIRTYKTWEQEHGDCHVTREEKKSEEWQKEQARPEISSACQVGWAFVTMIEADWMLWNFPWTSAGKPLLKGILSEPLSHDCEGITVMVDSRVGLPTTHRMCLYLLSRNTRMYYMCMISVHKGMSARSCCFIRQRLFNVLKDMQWLVPCEGEAEQRGMRKRAGGATAAAWLNQGTSEVEAESRIVITWVWRTMRRDRWSHWINGYWIS